MLTLPHWFCQHIAGLDRSDPGIIAGASNLACVKEEMQNLCMVPCMQSIPEIDPTTCACKSLQLFRRDATRWMQIVLMASAQLSCAGRHQFPSVKPFSSPQQTARRAFKTRHVCACSATDITRGLDRRETLLSLAAAAAALNVSQAEAEGGELTVRCSP